MAICKSEAKAATSQLISIQDPAEHSVILQGSETKPESTVLKSGTLTTELTSWTYVPDLLRITLYLLVRHLSKGNRKLLAQIKNCFFFTELQPTKTGGLPTAFIWFIPRIHDWRETDYWSALTYARRNYSRAWWHQVVKYIVIALGYSVCKSLNQRIEPVIFRSVDISR